MALEKQVVIDQIMKDEHGNILYRISTRIMEDGVKLSESYWRGSVMPGQDLTNLPEEVKAFCTAAWNPENVTKWSKSFIALQETERQKQAEAVAAVETEKAGLVAAQAAVEVEKAKLVTAQAELEVLKKAAAK